MRRWRKAGWPNVSQITRRLLRHWWREDRSRRLFFCQLEAVETVIYLRELLARGRTPRWRPKLNLREYALLCEGHNPRPETWTATVAQHPKLADFPHQPGARPIPRYACKMATGSGKTVVMAMIIAWAFCNRGAIPRDPRFPRRVLVVCPNLAIKERQRVLRPAEAGNYYEQFDLVPSAIRPELAKGKVLVTNWHRLSPESEVIKVGTVNMGRIGEKMPEAFARNRLGDLWDDEPLLVLNDEGHHAYRPAAAHDETLSAHEKLDREAATVWVDGLDRINAACGIDVCIDLSATPFYLQGSGYPEGSPFPWIVSDFSLVDAIECGITKMPRIPASDITGRPDPKYFKLWEHVTSDLKTGERLSRGRPKPEVVCRKAEDALLTHHVACDTDSWEQVAMFQFEKLAERGTVACYVRNDHLEFNIPFELYGEPRAYEPDFIVRLSNGVHVMVEIKGRSRDDTSAKHQAAQCWVTAVNHWGRLGEWDFLVCRDPQLLGLRLTEMLNERQARTREAAARVHEQAEREVAKLRAQGWKKQDFARALGNLLGPDSHDSA